MPFPSKYRNGTNTKRWISFSHFSYGRNKYKKIFFIFFSFCFFFSFLSRCCSLASLVLLPCRVWEISLDVLTYLHYQQKHHYIIAKVEDEKSFWQIMRQCLQNVCEESRGGGRASERENACRIAKIHLTLGLHDESYGASLQEVHELHMRHRIDFVIRFNFQYLP